jgi:hypothetical protein
MMVGYSVPSLFYISFHVADPPKARKPELAQSPTLTGGLDAHRGCAAQ